MNLIKIINARNVLENFADDENISASLSYWMSKFIFKTQKEYEFYITEVRKIFEELAETFDGEDTKRIPQEKVNEFNEAVYRIGETDVEEPGIRFKLSDLTSGLKISMKQMYPLLDFIDEEK